MLKRIILFWLAVACACFSQNADSITISSGVIWSMRFYPNGSAYLSLGADHDAFVKVGEFDFDSILAEMSSLSSVKSEKISSNYKLTISKGGQILNTDARRFKDTKYISILFGEVARKCRVRADDDVSIFNQALADTVFPPFGVTGLRINDSQVGGSPFDMFTADDIARLPEESTTRMSWEWKYGAVKSVPNKNKDSIENNEIDAKSMNAVNESDEKSSDAADRQSTVNKLPATDAGGSAGYLFFALTCISIFALLAVLIFRKKLRKR